MPFSEPIPPRRMSRNCTRLTTLDFAPRFIVSIVRNQRNSVLQRRANEATARWDWNYDILIRLRATCLVDWSLARMTSDFFKPYSVQTFFWNQRDQKIYFDSLFTQEWILYLDNVPIKLTWISGSWLLCTHSCASLQWKLWAEMMASCMPLSCACLSIVKKHQCLMYEPTALLRSLHLNRKMHTT